MCLAMKINVLPGQSIVPTGIILTGRPGDTGVRPSWALDGSFLAFRKVFYPQLLQNGVPRLTVGSISYQLKQLVPEFNTYLTAHAVQNAAGTLTTAQGAELLGARVTSHGV